MASASGAAAAPIEGLASLPPAALLAWLASLSTFLCDCDGVLWRADSGVPGVAHTVAAPILVIILNIASLPCSAPCRSACNYFLRQRD